MQNGLLLTMCSIVVEVTITCNFLSCVTCYIALVFILGGGGGGDGIKVKDKSLAVRMCYSFEYGSVLYTDCN